MRISDWSSDVCSSDLDDARVLADRAVPLGAHAAVRQYLRHRVLRGGRDFALIGPAQCADIVHRMEIADVLERVGDRFDQIVFARPEERRAGKEGVSTCNSRWSPYH